VFKGEKTGSICSSNLHGKIIRRAARTFATDVKKIGTGCVILEILGIYPVALFKSFSTLIVEMIDLLVENVLSKIVFINDWIFSLNSLHSCVS